ncbi:tetratricopeptide repeat protein [Rhodobacter capsulatus]|uniref:tetratricopeptide repeat protein n=1 Tax=Rhodobacter capsulatus TaxID=1061 RepID=UPI000A8B5D72|nr:tetratricopeptide repeat protein [Rhodobacter capsulatus]PZX22283.1 putative thioredoxin [Rhodobacter capsulatus]QNR63067.1 tetratricopeptide repeat protein [Rhodobacter capsulatus]
MFGTDTKPAQTFVKDVTETTFMAEVVDASMAVPVIVDFWAPWCGPCKTLGPQLEAAVNALKGRVVMAKINVDENQRLAQVLAQQGLPLQSIPTVVAFYQGRPVDMFQGAVPASQVKAFVEKLAGLAGDGGLGEALAAAEEMLAEGAAVDAAETFAAILGEEPENAEAYGGLVRAHLAAGNLEQAELILAGAPAKIATAAPVEAARAQLALAKQAAKAGPLDELKAKLTADPDDHQARFDHATALHAAGQVEEAVEELLELFRRDRDWNEGAAKTQLFTIFDSLKPADPIAVKGRRRLSSMIFA